jgi:hypothetical protein
MVYKNEHVIKLFEIILKIYLSISALCSIRINLTDVNDNPPSKQKENLLNRYSRIEYFSLCTIIMELHIKSIFE